MATTTTDPAAIAQLDASLRAWSSSAIGLVRQTTAATSAVVTRAEAAVRKCSANQSAVEAALSSARDEEDKTRLQRDLREATAALESAKRGLATASDAARSAQLLERRIGDSATGRVPDATRSLSKKLEALADYRDTGPPASTAGNAASNGPAAYDYGVEGISDVPLDQADFCDNPIRDGYHKGGAKVEDYRWAVETWETVVRPGVLAGKSRDDFESRDIAMGRESGFRRTAGVYDMFLGGDLIEFSRRADGSLDVASGRHRVEIAKQLGITHLPGRVHG